MSILLLPSEFEKARKLPEGSIRTWRGSRYQKVGGKWRPYREGKADPQRQARAYLNRLPHSELQKLADSPMKIKKEEAIFAIRELREKGMESSNAEAILDQIEIGRRRFDAPPPLLTGDIVNDVGQAQAYLRRHKGAVIGTTEEGTPLEVGQKVLTEYDSLAGLYGWNGVLIGSMGKGYALIVDTDSNELSRIQMKDIEPASMAKAQAMSIGTVQTWGGAKYRKTPQGWQRLQARQKKKETKDFARRTSTWHKEMREKFGGSWIGMGEVRGRPTMIQNLVKQGKAELDSNKVRFLKAEDEDDESEREKEYEKEVAADERKGNKAPALLKER